MRDRTEAEITKPGPREPLPAALDWDAIRLLRDEYDHLERGLDAAITAMADSEEHLDELKIQIHHKKREILQALNFVSLDDVRRAVRSRKKKRRRGRTRDERRRDEDYEDEDDEDDEDELDF